MHLEMLSAKMVSILSRGRWVKCNESKAHQTRVDGLCGGLIVCSWAVFFCGNMQHIYQLGFAAILLTDTGLILRMAEFPDIALPVWITIHCCPYCVIPLCACLHYVISHRAKLNDTIFICYVWWLMPYFYQYVHSTLSTIKVKFRVPTWWYPNILPIDAYIPFDKKKWQSYTNNITNIPFMLLSSVCTLSWTVAEKETKYATAYSIKFSTELFVLIVPTSVIACCVWGRAELCSWCTLTLAIIIVKKSFKP